MGGCRINTKENNGPRIFVDADSCPVKEEIAQLASDFSVKTIYVASYAHATSKPEYMDWDWRYVDSSREAADLYIMNHTKKGDGAVTQDIGLASTLLPKGVYVLSPRGIVFEDNTIQTALDIRFLKAKARARGDYGKGPSPFLPEDRERFLREYVKLLSMMTGREFPFYRET
ncbi:hypothetical protein AM500_09045 [Bacillus sp. FJAT-18017]|uniref:YaiI/YqxD family protein n=1 Tax=Bacillus sp. FJAT-18017 TaxID=1705566 RepID=UPI0006AEEB09|nr:DUF188 domain-containing protein [Bacillus sp. FJAT-18017]ALC89907.1 hypothetical protein AM500_09045 [Bacillus sp. FJAT-18017]